MQNFLERLNLAPGYALLRGEDAVLSSIAIETSVSSVTRRVLDLFGYSAGTESCTEPESGLCKAFTFMTFRVFSFGFPVRVIWLILRDHLLYRCRVHRGSCI